MRVMGTPSLWRIVCSAAPVSVVTREESATRAPPAPGTVTPERSDGSNWASSGMKSLTGTGSRSPPTCAYPLTSPETSLRRSPAASAAFTPESAAFSRSIARRRSTTSASAFLTISTMS